MLDDLLVLALRDAMFGCNLDVWRVGGVEGVHCE